MRDGHRFADLCSSNVWIWMLREFHVPGIAARTDSVTDEIGALPGHPFRFFVTESLWRVSEN